MSGLIYPVYRLKQEHRCPVNKSSELNEMYVGYLDPQNVILYN